jgi:hypothetical protein
MGRAHDDCLRAAGGQRGIPLGWHLVYVYNQRTELSKVPEATG